MSVLQSYILQHYTVSEEGHKATWKKQREVILLKEGLINAALFRIYDPQPPIIHLKKGTAVKVIVIPSIFFIFLFYGIFENDDYGREKAESNEEYEYLELKYYIVSNPSFLVLNIYM